ncbi:MAG: hypothetical protein B5M52_05085 [Helicobacteraceae bacterium 4484_230]|nr:MAG: hypothetical protein B5M52_05085 [Helicobacteraceae bacterium 4484_230]
MGIFSKLRHKEKDAEKKQNDSSAGKNVDTAADKFEVVSVPFNINAVLNDVANAVTVISREKGISLIFEMDKNVPSRVIGDRVRLGEVLINLLDNAIAFTDDGEVRLKISRVEEKKDAIRLRLSVIDTGVGIHHEAVEDILTPFLKGDIHSLKDFGITGKGLFVAREIVKRMDGQITVLSEQNKGTTFTAEVSLDAANLNEMRHYHLPSKAGVGLRVIVLDENIPAAESLKKFLEYFRHDVAISDPTAHMPESHELDGYAIIFVTDRFFKDEALKEKLLFAKSRGVKLVLIEDMFRESKNDKGALNMADRLIYKPYNQQMIFDLLVGLFGDKKVVGEKEKEPAEEEKDDSPKTESTFEPEELMLHKSRSDLDKDVLIVEIFEDTQNLILNILNDKGISAITAESSEEVLKLLKASNSFKLILLDMEIVETGIYKFIEQVKEALGDNPVPILAMLPGSFSEKIKQAGEIGIEGYLQIPFSPSGMAKLIDRYIGKKESPDSENSSSYNKKEQLFIAKKGMEHAGNDKKYFKKILDEFLIEYDDSVEYIRMLMEKHEFETAKKYCHPLKNTLANIGAFRLSYLVDLMEKAFADENLSEIENLYKMYPKEYKETVKEIESFQFHALKDEG